MGAYAFAHWYWDIPAWRAISGPDAVDPYRYHRSYSIVKWAIHNWEATYG